MARLCHSTAKVQYALSPNLHTVRMLYLVDLCQQRHDGCVELRVAAARSRADRQRHIQIDCAAGAFEILAFGCSDFEARHAHMHAIKQAHAEGPDHRTASGTTDNFSESQAAVA